MCIAAAPRWNWFCFFLLTQFLLLYRIVRNARCIFSEPATTLSKKLVTLHTLIKVTPKNGAHDGGGN
jgi:hypothetical protein